MSKWALMLMATVLLGALAIAGCQSNSPAEDDSSAARAASLSGSDQDFIRKAAIGGKMEVEMGQAAAQRGSSDAVRRYGQRLVSDHQRANSELTSLASRKGVNIPEQLDAESRRMVDMLSSVSGRDFDRQFIQHAIQDHEKDIAEFERAARSANDPDLRGFASRTLPVLRQHLAQARDIAGQLGLAGGNTSGLNR